MATSGSQNFSQTRNEVILDAFQILGVYGIGRTVSAEDMTFASSMLNKMVKAWVAKGLHLWAKEEAVLYITPNTSEYRIGNAVTDAYATKLSDQVINRLNGSHVAAATSLTLDSTSGMTAADYIGVVTTDKTIHWTTISSITNSTTLLLTTGLDSAASDSALVYTFTNRIYKPSRILSCRRRTGYDSGSTSSIVDIPMTSVASQTYFENPAKTTNGVPSQYMYLPQNTSGALHLWPRPSDGSERIHFTYERMIEDLDNSSDDFDFPSEWLEALTYQLAVRLARPFGKPSAAQDILPMASEMLDNLLSWDNEVVSVQFSPDLGN